MPEGQNNSAYWAALSAAGGQPPYHWSIASGQLPDGLALNANQGVISGTAGHTGAFTFKLRVEDSGSSAQPGNADFAINVDPTGSTPAGAPGCTGNGCYGPGIGADGLSNTTVGQWGNVVSYRFRAQKTGEAQKLRLYLITDHPGYSAGTAGKLKIDMVTDDGTAAHNPGSTVLATYVLDSPLTATPSPAFPLITFSTPPSLVSGQLYHIVFSNVDDNPTENFLSVDALFIDVATAPVQPAISDMYAAVLLRDAGNGTWATRAGQTPIMEVIYSDGTSTGIGYIEGWVGARENVSGDNAVRETFTISGSARKVGLVGIRAARTSGNDGLTVRLENDDGSVIEQGVIPANSFPLNSSPNDRWGTYVFSSAHVLTPGNKYHLVFETAASSNYQLYPVRKGKDYGFGPSTFYNDGSAEMKEGGDWTGWTQWGVANRSDGDLQFYFGIVQ